MKKKIVLLGDSIRLIGYGTALPQIMGDDAEIWQPEDNSRFVQYVLRQVFDYADKIDEADIVHFNSGEWDVCRLFDDGTFTSAQYYIEQLVRIADILLKKGKKVVFATTTPVRPENIHNFNEDIAYFNDLAVKVLEPMGVIINDLYSVVMADLEKYVREDDNIHLTEDGINLCATATANCLNKINI